MPLYRYLCVASTVVAVVWAPKLAAAADAKSAASQTAALLDEDFFLQGEYAGTIVADGVPAWTGLQVVALGNGDFQAVEYAGGLPGNGWDMRTRRKYTGRKSSGGKVELAGSTGRFVVFKGAAAAVDAQGKSLGRLKKFQRVSQTLRAAPPPGALVLFSGRDARQFKSGIVTPDHLLVAGAETNKAFQDFTLHLEFRTPYMAAAREQGRGNSGVYIQGRYEVQILDSFGLEGADNECGGLYKQRAPLLNMCFPPLSWQTYDIDFTAPRFDASGKKTQNARITVRHNGIVIHKDAPLTAKTGGGAQEGPDARPLLLQDHGNLVHFRNIWLVERPAAAYSQAGVWSAGCSLCP
ncbi:MAG TPA: DUF1080 domain-containing protein [Planctomycetaceae bacterium]|nr:DUF1080 domain-containing protein [Planctomycetaceae bacterium]